MRHGTLLKRLIVAFQWDIETYGNYYHNTVSQQDIENYAND